ncbi:MAG: energy transducer TonB [Bacteroidales bacterium]
METNKEHVQLFSPSGCLTGEAMRSFAGGRMPEADRDTVRKHLDTCEFCSMAYEGISLMIQEKGEDSYRQLLDSTKAQLEAKLDSFSAQDDRPMASRKVRTIWTLASVAATIIMLIGLYMVIQLFVPQNPQLAVLKEDSITAAEFAEMQQPPPPASEPVTKEQAGQKVKFTAPVVVSDNLTEQDDFIQEDASPVKADLKEETVAGLTKDIAVSEYKAKTDSTTVSLSLSPTAQQTYAAPLHFENISDVAVIEKKNYKNKRAKSATAGKEAVKSDITEEEGMAIFSVVEEMPSFPGGEEARIKFLSENIQYPQTAKESNISGTVYVSFVVTEKGRIKDVKVIRSIGGGCDEEAVRVIKMMPRWEPGRQAGKPVNVQFTMPVKFTL